ncbi:MAG: C4-type zinc ribbon domain-containing protein [Candidatus Omnitrophica bacterium]|nr:C4-type zinc ribbon domain-containing protein [Candidatus Omnitrophota bacterium]
MSKEEQIKMLIQLQKLDSRIFAAKKELANQPLIIRALEEEFKNTEAGLKSVEEEQKALAIKRKERESDLQSKEDAIKKLQAQLYSIKTNKEYQAMEHEIASQKADASVIEEDILRFFDQSDECAKRVAQQKEALAQERKKFDEQKQVVDKRAKEIEASLAQVNAQRNELAHKADKEFLAKYERILHSKDGIAMVPVEGDACGGCNINLPPQVINEIRMNEDLIFCGNCARILYIEE